MPDLSSAPSNHCSFAFDLTDQKFLFISPNVNAFLGYTACDLFENPGLVFDMIDQKHLEKIKQSIQNMTAGVPVDLYYPIKTAAGEKKWIHNHKSLVTGTQPGHRVLLSIIDTNDPENLHRKEEARLHEQFLNSLIDSQTNFMIRFDTGGNFTFANRQFLKSLGYKKNEIVGKHFSVVTVPEELDMCRKAFYNCVSHPGKVIHLAHKKLDKWGALHDTDWEFVSVTNDEGTVIALQGIGHDITEKLITEKEVKTTAQKLDTFIESITDSFFIINNDWKFVRVNAAFEKVCNMSRKDMLGGVIWQLFPGILDTGFEHAYRKAAAEKVKVQFTEHFEPLDMWFNTTVYPSGEGLTVFVRDITDEKQAQQEALWTKSNLEALINNTEDQIWSVDTETRYMYMNTAYRRQISELTGLEPQKGSYSYLHPGYTAERLEQWSQYYARALSGERYTIISESVDLLTKKLLSFEVSFNPIYNIRGDITGVGCFARNITEWLETKKAIVDQNERLRHIASLTSHELRRPVASLLGLINLMDKHNFFNPDNKEVIEHLLTVGNEIDDVIRLIVDKTFIADMTKGKYQSP
jgi:PAS domain S-box-containing protein